MIVRTRKEAAAFLRVSEKTLERLYKKPDGPPAEKVGRRVLYPDTEEWLETKVGQRFAKSGRARRRVSRNRKDSRAIAHDVGSVRARKSEQTPRQ